ncbi:unnamed protein product, partial [Owenia fusiformis]
QRFPNISAEEIDRIHGNIHSDNTIKATKRSVKIFQDWISSKDDVIDLENVSKSTLNEKWNQIYLEARSIEREHYKSSTFQRIRHGINCHLQNIRQDDIDIIFMETLN